MNQVPTPYTIIVPARNEEHTIAEVLRAVRGMTDDLIVVDGHSRDSTVAIARACGARVAQDNGRGEGDAIRVGLALARHPIVVFVDADGSHEPNDIPKLVAPIVAGEADLVIGSRILGGSEELLTPHKNVTTLVDAYARLLREWGLKDVRLVLVGEFREEVFYSGHAALQKQIEVLGLSGQVIFTGFVADADLVNFYNVAHALVMPSFNEGFGLPAVEAMACGTPIIASRAGALPEVVGEAGFFFDPRDSEELAKGLQEVLENASLQAALGRAALRQAQHYSWEQSARAALAAFSKLADPHVSAPA